MFAEKLDLLMNLTDTTNIKLASAIHVDPSYISKLRNGKRSLPKHSYFLSDLSEYLSKQLVRPGQIQTLERVTKKSWPLDSIQAKYLIFDWLSEDEDVNIINRFLENITNPEKPNLPVPPLIKQISTDKPRPYYIGVEGKRQAVTQFFEAILQNNKACHLKLFSEENMSWLTDDPEFLNTWRQMFSEVLRKGNSVTIVHHLSRNLDELMASIIQWLPIYVTGNIIPYYCPRKRDGIFQRTVFLAPNIAAITSTGIHNDSSDMLNFYLTDADALQAVEHEFDRFLNICRPLLRISSSNCLENYCLMFDSMVSKTGNTYLMSQLPSLATLPDDYVQELEKTYNVALTSTHQLFKERRLQLIAQGEFHEILQLPMPTHSSDPLLLPQSLLYSQKPLYYDNDGLKRHFREVLRLLKTHEHYYVYLVEHVHHGLKLLVNSNQGIIIERLNPPPIIYGFEEYNISSAFLNHLQDACRHAHVNQKEETIKYLENYVNH